MQAWKMQGDLEQVEDQQQVYHFDTFLLLEDISSNFYCMFEGRQKKMWNTNSEDFIKSRKPIPT